MVDVVYELGFTGVSIEKLGRRGISPAEALQVPGNRYVILPNPPSPSRRLLIGATNGGRTITLVVERTPEPADWLIVSGWDSPSHERKMLWR